MIRSFADSRTEALAGGFSAKGVPSDVLKRAVNKLFLLDTATRLDDRACRRANVWRLWSEIDRGSTRSESTISGGSVSFERTTVRMTSTLVDCH